MFKNKTIKLFLILGVILFSHVGVVGCSNPTGSDNVNATYIRTNFDDEEDVQIKVVNNCIDLVTLLENDVPKKYNDDFFETKSLLVFKISESGSGTVSEIESYIINDKTLNVYVKTKQYGNTADLGYWWFILELNKDEVEIFDNVKIFKNGEEIMNGMLINKKPLSDDEISDYIKNIFLNKINNESKKTISIEDINILYFLGQYGDNYAAIIEGDCMAIPEKTIVIDDLLFEYVRESISVYNKNTYYSLKEAYELNLINYEQLFTIYNLYQEYKSNIT